MRDREPAELVAIFVPVLAEFIAVGLAICTAALWILYFAGRLPEIPA
jgi:ABC-type nickel/cobalt efflux system permease component RcnA